MREIKFRAWDNENKVMGYFPNDDNMFEIQDFRGFINCYEFSDIISNVKYEIMQYTGLKDKNGKEIYEGDVLRYKKSGLFYKVLCDFECGRYFFVKQEENKIIDISWHIQMEVIGNIHENPEIIDTEPKGK